MKRRLRRRTPSSQAIDFVMRRSACGGSAAVALLRCRPLKTFVRRFCGGVCRETPHTPYALTRRCGGAPPAHQPSGAADGDWT
jgi:hypothetical protein